MNERMHIICVFCNFCALSNVFSVTDVIICITNECNGFRFLLTSSFSGEVFVLQFHMCLCGVLLCRHCCLTGITLSLLFFFPIPKWNLVQRRPFDMHHNSIRCHCAYIRTYVLFRLNTTVVHPIQIETSKTNGQVCEPTSICHHFQSRYNLIFNQER